VSQDPPQPLEPTLTAHLFPALGRELVGLLDSLPGEAWSAPTVCPGWTVKDVASHLLDTACRRLAYGRDRLAPPGARGGHDLSDYGTLVGLIDRLNAEWVEAARRLSPRLLTGLLAWIEPQLAAYFAGLDPWAPAPIAVAWAGEESSVTWFDVGRELTERWHHQQQIRLAVGAPALSDAETSKAVFDTFLRALPYRYAGVPAPEGAALELTLRGAASHVYTLRRDGDGWRLLRGGQADPDAAIDLDEEVAWRVLTKGLPPYEARRRSAIRGNLALAQPFFAVVAVMA